MSYEVREVVEKIKRKREELNLSYKELEKKTGISASTLYRYEIMETQIPIDKFQVICKELGLKAEELLSSKKTDNEYEEDFKLAARNYKELPAEKKQLFNEMMKSVIKTLKEQK